MSSEARERFINSLLIPVLAVISGLLLASVAVIIAGQNPITAYAKMFTSAFSCQRIGACNLFVTLQFATPLILTGLSAVVAFRSGLFSLGQEGQLMLGGIVAAWIGFALTLPPVIHAFVAIVAALIVGGIYGWIPGVLRVKLDVNELISTIVLNTIATLYVTYLIQFPLRADASTTAATPVVLDSARLMTFAPGSKWGVGFVLAILAGIVVYIYLWRSSAGYEQRMAGQSSLFALFGGIPSDRAAIRGMIISGMLAGMAGAIQVLGVHYRMLDGFSAGLGFDGVTAAILGQVHPIGTMIVAIFFAGVRNGAQIGMQISLRVPRELGGGIIALMILFVAADKLFRDRIDSVEAWWKRLRGQETRLEELS